MKCSKKMFILNFKNRSNLKIRIGSINVIVFNGVYVMIVKLNENY